MEYVAPPRRRIGLIAVAAIVLLILIGSRSLASFYIDFLWWKELGQVETWTGMISYRVLPVVLAAALLFAVLWLSHAHALKRAGARLRDNPVYSRLSTGVLLLLTMLVTASSVDSWTVVRWFGGSGLGGGWRDPVFSLDLGFYFFSLPFYRMLLGWVIAGAVATALVSWAAYHFWELRRRFPNWQEEMREGTLQLDLRDLGPKSALESRLLRLTGSVALLAWGANVFLSRYEQLFADHGSLVGIDWTAENVTIPLLWLEVAVALAAAFSLALGRWKPILAAPAAAVLASIAPSIVHSVYVRPSEITIQKPYIQRHIEATRVAYGLTQKVQEVDFAAKLEAPLHAERHRPMLDNVRLWDWRAFHDTVTQIQALRPYYVFQDSDVDRYVIDGKLRQILLTPRELDVRQLPADARARWINPHFIYTHGYGLVAAEAARITQDGLPVLLVQNAPPEARTPVLKPSRPEIYFGEVSHEPVFVRTAQAEFNYPQGSGNVENRYDGRGGFPITSLLTRAAAALRQGDWNILLTSYLTGESRMMIRRRVQERLQELAGFLVWDRDPYLVVTQEGRLVWLADGYTTSASHPYARSFSLENAGQITYMRNSVKATVDAYDGTVRLYVFDDADPVLGAYRRLFPVLFHPAAAMPADLRAHARYPELLFRLQAEVYRTYHMRDPEAFFNKEDMWDLARNLNSPSGKPEPVAPTYIVATVPGSDEPEFLLMTSFTPRNKDNLIGLMVARCDGPRLGELLFLQLSKQELVFGPMQIEARISQDQVISKDLTLWNQQGSQVLRGQMLVLPIENTLLYIEPIYIQASEARMPQLKKIVLAMGNRLIYADTYEQALAELASGQPAPKAAPPTAGEAPAPAPVSSAAAIEQMRGHLARYKSLMSQGKYAEAGRELEALEKLMRD